MTTLSETPAESTDPDDIESLRDDTRRENQRLANQGKTERELRRMRNDANRDGQDFRDAIDAHLPQGARDVVAESESETREIEELDVLDALRAMQTGDPIRWRIYRIGHTDTTLNGFLAEWPTAQLTQERLKDEFGGGTYRIRGYRTNGTYAAHRTINIAGDVVKKSGSMAATQSGFDLSAFLAQQDARDTARRKDEETRREREKREAEERDEKRRRERNEMLAIVMPAVTGLTTALVGAFAANRGPDLAALIAAMKGPDPITVLTQLKALQGNTDGALTKILPMLIDMAGSKASAGDTGWLDVVKELAKSAGPTIGGMIEMSVQQARTNALAAQNHATVNGSPTLTPSLPAPSASGATMTGPVAPQVPAAGVIVVPEPVARRERVRRSVTGTSLPVGSTLMPAAPAAGTVAGNSPSTTPAGGLDMNLLPLLPHLPWLKDQLARMLTAARRGKDPEVYAALFLEETPDGIDSQVLGQFLSRADWYQQLMSLEAGLNDAALEPWFQQLRRLLLQSLISESEPGSVGAAALSPSPTSGQPTALVTGSVSAKPTDLGKPEGVPSLTSGRT